MNNITTRILRIIPGIALSLLSASIVQAVPYCAETISQTSIYSLQAATAGGEITSRLLWSGGTNLGGIATYDKYALVTDNAIVSNKDGVQQQTSVLRVFDLSTRQQVGDGITIGIRGKSGVQSAGQVSVDGNGNVYVIDSSKGNSDARFAKITSWSNPTEANVSYDRILGYSQVDVAGLETGGAAILVQGNEDYEEIGVTTASGDAPALVQGNNKPIAIAASRTTNNSYMLSSANTLDNGQIVTSTVLRTCQPGSVNLATAGVNGIGQDVAMISDGTIDYAAVITTNGNRLEATRIAVTDGLANGPESTVTIASGDSSLTHYAGASSDGKMLWVTAMATGKVYGVSSVGWSTISSLTLGDYIGGIATHECYSTVPEPSSLLALLTMGAGALGMLRRKK